MNQEKTIIDQFMESLIPFTLDRSTEKPAMHELQVMMLGPWGVGKTSLLAAMYEQFTNGIGGINLQLIVDEESENALLARLTELKSLTDDFEAKGGVKGTTGAPSHLRSFKFSLGQRGKKPSLRLHFWDYPGGFHLRENPPEARRFLKEKLNECVAVLVAINAPALMEREGKWHDASNCPLAILNLFSQVYQELQSPRLVIFAPIRCEKYMQDSKTANKLVQGIKQGYEGLFDFFSADTLRSNVAVVITPVQTVGTVVFSRIEMIGGEPHFHFRKIAHDKGYAPKDSEQPLRYLLSFLLRLHLTKRSTGFFGFLRKLFNTDQRLAEEIHKLSMGRKATDGFAIVQGEDLLK